MEKKKLLIIGISALIVLIAIIYWIVPRGGKEVHGEGLTEVPDQAPAEVSMAYGIDYSNLALEEGTIQSGQTLSAIFQKWGVGPVMIDRTVRAAEGVFSLRRIKAGKPYTAFLTTDSIPRLEHFVYEDNVSDYLVISYLPGDSISVRLEHKDVDVERKVATGHITSSLWNSMVDAGMHPGFIKNFEDIFAWTIDFFGLQDGDHFTVIYDERSIEGTPIDGGRIWGAVFNHNGKDIYAIPFRQGSDKITYWDLTGNSLRKSMLKAPLKYSRISSRFSNSRLHPVLKIRRPHHGVDYAAPMGTPVVAVADGTISFKGWDSKGGGNVVKIKHSQGMQTGYLHLSKFGPGIANGKRVSQGDVIGYVGSTGTSTGPHLDYRVWINGKAIDPLKVTAEPAEPITSANKPDFELIKERILAELKGELPDSMRIVQLDSLQVYRRQGALPAAEGETRDSLP